jgi:hypothetical protein
MDDMDTFKHKQACYKLTCLQKHVIEGKIEGSDRKTRKEM